MPKKGKGKKKDAGSKRKRTVGKGKFVSTINNFIYNFTIKE